MRALHKCHRGLLWRVFLAWLSNAPLMHCRRIKEHASSVFGGWGWKRRFADDIFGMVMHIVGGIHCWWVDTLLNRVLLVGIASIALGPASTVAPARALPGLAYRASSWTCSNLGASLPQLQAHSIDQKVAHPSTFLFQFLSFYGSTKYVGPYLLPPIPTLHYCKIILGMRFALWINERGKPAVSYRLTK
jgi:hypothetical protein